MDWTIRNGTNGAGSRVPESQTVAEVLASNVRAFRQLRGLEQDKLARRMQSLGHLWRQATVSEVERRQRSVTVPELVALTLVLDANISQLLDPRGPERLRGPHLVLADRAVKITGDTDATTYTETTPVMLSVPAIDAGGVVCSHETYIKVEWDSDRHSVRQLQLGDISDLTGPGS